jgi:hypothetical protein
MSAADQVHSYPAVEDPILLDIQEPGEHWADAQDRGANRAQEGVRLRTGTEPAGLTTQLALTGAEEARGPHSGQQPRQDVKRWHASPQGAMCGKGTPGLLARPTDRHPFLLPA